MLSGLDPAEVDSGGGLDAGSARTVPGNEVITGRLGLVHKDRHFAA